MLKSDDEDIVLMTIDTLHVCSRDPPNRTTLSEVSTMIDTLWTLSIEHVSPKVRFKAGQLVNDLDCEKSSSPSCASSTYLSSFTSRRRYCTQLNVITLEIQNMKTLEKREKFHQDAVRLSGIVSVTMGSKSKRAKLYTTEPDIQDHVVNYLRCKGWTVALREEANSTSTGFRLDENDIPGEASNKKPKYLKPEVVKVEVLGKNSLGYYRPNKNTETLSQRIARYKREQTEGLKKEKGSIISSVVNFFW